MSLGGLDPVPKIDPRCKWYHLLSDSTWRMTYSSVITDQQRRDRSQQGDDYGSPRLSRMRSGCSSGHCCRLPLNWRARQIAAQAGQDLLNHDQWPDRITRLVGSSRLYCRGHSELFFEHCDPVTIAGWSVATAGDSERFAIRRERIFAADVERFGFPFDC